MQVTEEVLAQFLAKTDIFDGFDAEEIELFVPLLELTTVASGHTIFREGTIGDAWFVILEGEVSVTKEMISGPPHVLSHLFSGDSFGEMALMDGAPRMATLYAEQETFLARLSRDSSCSCCAMEKCQPSSCCGRWLLCFVSDSAS